MNNIVTDYPRLNQYVNHFFELKPTPHKHKSISENLQNASRKMPNQNDRSSNQTARSLSSPSIQAAHQKIVDPHPVRLADRGRRDFSGKVGYKVPNINYNTALRSSKRPNKRDLEDEDDNYYNR